MAALDRFLRVSDATPDPRASGSPVAVPSSPIEDCSSPLAPFGDPQSSREVVASEDSIVWHWDIASDAMFVSKRWDALNPTGSHPRPSMRPQLIATVHPDDQVTMDTALHALRSGEMAEVCFDCRVRRADGSDVVVRFSAFANASPTGAVPTAVVGTARDTAIDSSLRAELSQVKLDLEHRVSERTAELAAVNAWLQREMEAAQAESAARYRMLFESLDAAVLLLDGDRCIDCNPAALRLFGLRDRKELIGNVPLDIAPPRNAEGESRQEFVRRNLATALDSGPLVFEWPSIRPDGATFCMEVRAAPFRFHERTLLQCIALDITERRKLEDRLHQARLELEERVRERTAELASVNEWLKREMEERQQAHLQLNELQEQIAHVARLATLGELAAGLAHELNQPHTAIANYAETCLLALESQTQEVDPAELLQEIVNESLRAGAIIRRLRALVRKEVVYRERLEITPVICEAVALLQSTLDLKGITTAVRGAPELPLVAVDRVQIQQAIVNLVRNAIDAIEAGPHPAAGQIVIDILAVGSELEVAVHDTGCGLPPDADLLFMPFKSGKADGLGIGLSISRSIVEAHSGRIWAEPEPTGGACFRLRLPVEALEPARA